MKRLQSHVRYIGQELDGAGGPATFLFISHSIEHSHTLLRTGTVSKAPVNPFVSNLTATDGPNGVGMCDIFGIRGCRQKQREGCQYLELGQR